MEREGAGGREGGSGRERMGRGRRMISIYWDAGMDLLFCIWLFWFVRDRRKKMRNELKRNEIKYIRKRGEIIGVETRGKSV